MPWVETQGWKGFMSSALWIVVDVFSVYSMNLFIGKKEDLSNGYYAMG